MSTTATTTTTDRRAALLAAIQSSTKAVRKLADNVAELNDAYAKRSKDREALTLALHVATLDTLSPVARKRVTEVNKSVTYNPVSRRAITREIFATLNRKGTGGWLYRGDINAVTAKAEKIGRFASEHEIARILGESVS